MNYNKSSLEPEMNASMKPFILYKVPEYIRKPLTNNNTTSITTF